MPAGTNNAEKRIAARPSPEDAQATFDITTSDFQGRLCLSREWAE